MAEAVQINQNEAKLLSDDRFLRKVAYMYYDENNPQDAIAKKTSCSRQTISKAIQKAKEKGIVRISITPDLRVGYLRNLSREVRTELDLDDLVLVPGGNMISTPAGEDLDDVVAEITSSAAEYLDQMLVDGDIVSVSGGKRFMRNLVRFLKPTKVLPHMHVIASIGFAEARTNFGDANLIAYDMAESFGAEHSWFPCPAILHNAEQVQQVRQLPIVKEAYNLMMRSSVVVTSLWSVHSLNDMVVPGALTRDMLEVMEAHDPVLDINHWMFDAAGKCINESIDAPPYYLSGLEIPRLKDKIEREKARVILVAGGNAALVPAIRSAMRARLANILVTDHITAELLLENN